VAVFLATQNWSQQDIGVVLTAAGLTGLAGQIPGGELLDFIRSKAAAAALGAIMTAAGAVAIASWPGFPLVLAALILRAITGGFLGLAIAAISLGLLGHAALERLGPRPHRAGFRELKRFKRVAMRCEKTLQNYPLLVDFACGLILRKSNSIRCQIRKPRGRVALDRRSNARYLSDWASPAIHIISLYTSTSDRSSPFGDTDMYR
jgi:hypothetical protein